jgi:hypothetical protein
MDFVEPALEEVFSMARKLSNRDDEISFTILGTAEREQIRGGAAGSSLDSIGVT